MYGAAVAARNTCFDLGILSREMVPCPIISIGNITAGGSGKTPFAAYVVAELVERARRPVILSRGYGGTIRGPHEVKPLDSVLDVGDEAVMQAKRLYPAVKTVVSRDRVAGARFVVEENLGDVIVLDDGFQHRYLDRDIDILLIDVTSEATVEAILNNSMLPTGPIREPLSSAVTRAHVIVLVRRSTSPEEFTVDPRLLERLADIPTFKYWLRPVEFVDVATGASRPLDAFNDKKCSAITAIANGQRFFEMLTELGADLAYTKAFPDHHLFSVLDWAEVQREGSGPIIMTAKDAVKLDSYARIPDKAFMLRISGEFATIDDRKRFWKIVTRATRIN